MSRVDWTVTGRLETTRNFPDSPADPTTRRRPWPLVDVEVVLLREENDGNWNRIANATTDRDGAFSLTGRANDSEARFQILARFRNDEVFVRPAAIASAVVDDGDTWMNVFEDTAPTGSFSRNVGNLTFGQSGATADLRRHDHVIRAIFWHVAELLARRLRGANPLLAFQGRVHVIFPGHGGSYATHIVDFLTQRQVHVAQDTADSEKILTLVHEMMHIWNYDHNRGTTNWLAGVASQRHGWDGDTNGDLFSSAKQEWPNIAFHEAFAEFAALELLHVLFDEPKPLPYRRGFLAARMGLTPPVAPPPPQLGRSVRATMSALHCLTTPDLHLYTFGTGNDSASPQEITRRTGNIRPVNPPWPAMTIFQVLTVFLSGGWQVDERNNGIRQFLALTSALFPTLLTIPVRDLILDLINPTSTVEPLSIRP